jgi:hypothetical protein
VWKTLTPKQRKHFAKLAKTTPGSLRHQIEGRRPFSTELAVKVEKATVKMGLPIVNRGDLNETCGRCDYARYCKKVDLT